jgi:hypothetical protein
MTCLIPDINLPESNRLERNFEPSGVSIGFIHSQSVTTAEFTTRLIPDSYFPAGQIVSAEETQQLGRRNSVIHETTENSTAPGQGYSRKAGRGPKNPI